ncbi:hypothetical protein [Halorhodospira sp. 9622]|uniref:hypothetical protein n=1 Tax=Halorhodospira sp. 9622 TaxID=2899136 RepID=UPI001EE97651|nr:hypothetical protein [Halorhodospira sp. 9622]MCG5537206.1 hypothetical protein [Halorhodospira sp. 9622]
MLHTRMHSGGVLAAVLLVGLLLAACARTAALEEPTGVPIEGDWSLEEIADVIRDAGRERGWAIREEADGHMVGVLNVRDHRAEVDIHFDETSLDIEYRDSVNLRYDEERQTIHRNYNRWVDHLEQDLRVRLTR